MYVVYSIGIGILILFKSVFNNSKLLVFEYTCNFFIVYKLPIIRTSALLDLYSHKPHVNFQTKFTGWLWLFKC